MNNSNKQDEDNINSKLTLIEKYNCLNFYYGMINCLNENAEKQDLQNCEVK